VTKRFALGAAFLIACGHAPPSSYRVTFATAERAEGSGRYAEAAREFDDAARVAPNPREKAHAEYAAAQMLVKSGDRQDGAAKLQALADASPAGEHSGQAAYELARLRIAEKDASGWPDLENAMNRFPNEGVAHLALKRLATHVEETSGAPAAITWLEKIAPRFESTELVQAVAYETAKRIDTGGDLADARVRYLAIAERWPYPHGAYWDNSLFRASAIDEKNGHFDDAIAELEQMLHQRETASMIGSYERPMYLPAAWHIAEIYRDELHDDPRAEAAFHRVYADFTTSLKRDDALWEEAALLTKTGDAATACTRLSTLTSQFPDSRYVSCATQQCADLSRPSKSRAPKECRTYLTAKTHETPKK